MSISNPGLIFLSAFIVNNILLMRYIGLCPFFGVSTSLTTAFGMSAAVLFVMLLATWVTWIIHRFILLPLDIVFLRTATFILVIAALVQFVEMFLKKNFKTLYTAMGIYLPLITTNCAILGVTLLVINYNFDLARAIIFALGTALGFGLVIILFSAIRERLEFAPIVRSLKGYPIAFISASLVALAFLGFIGFLGLSL
ncbi:MAG: RnfABCDGE type electron transport complex subunit A [candidate division WOR-3 bacterium]|nr:RnfABCDGE type electron transport complex subunit A [candidate division WOR-3 bacterium]MCX7756751.1 RnfABCDGE type electron transport complex subunit A [candidate division WOR-3 bacterium]MDW7987365.1 RnfABCDGE type electron transport complex subunit A [candidate division WOR-3 bacterium]